MPDIDYSKVYVVFLNGPPGCGKDSGAKVLTCEINSWGKNWSRVFKFAEHLKRSVLADAGLPYDDDLEKYEADKDVPKAIWGGVSFRQRCIIKSEDYFKPQFGDEYFGEVTSRKLESAVPGVKQALDEFGESLDCFIALITDSGFESETRPLLRKIPHENCLHVRIHAEGRGKTFEGDSRSYITLPDTVKVVDVENNVEGAEAFTAYTGELEKWIRGTFNF